MAKGSEQFAWKLFGDAERICWECKREIKKRDEVGEHRRKYPGGKNEFLCTTCQKERVERMIERNREDLGLP